MMSLNRRLSLGLAAAGAALIALNWWMMRDTPERLTEQYVEERLEHATDKLYAGLQFDPAGKPVLSPRYVDSAYTLPESGFYYAIHTPDHDLLSPSLQGHSLEMPRKPPANSSIMLRGHTPTGDPTLLRITHREWRGEDVLVAVAENINPLEVDVAASRWRIAAVTLATLILLTLVQRLIVRSSLQPLVRLRADLRRLQAGEIAQLDSEVPREIEPLRRELNTVLAALEARNERARNAVANLAHAVKTPLARLGQSLETPGVPQVMREDAQLAIEHIDASIRRELQLARIGGRHLPGRTLSVRRAVDDVLRVLRRIHHEPAIGVELIVPSDLYCRIDRHDMLELLGNLLDNAFKWARHKIRIQAWRAGSVYICIEDDGTGVSDDNLARLAERGWRADEARPGHGMGLAIVRDLVAAYEGDLHFARSDELGGLSVEFSIPCPADNA